MFIFMKILFNPHFPKKLFTKNQFPKICFQWYTLVESLKHISRKNKLGCFGLDAKLTWHEIDKNLYIEQTNLLSNGKNHLSAQSPKKPHSNKPKWFHILYGKRYVFHFTRQGLGLNFSSRRRRVWVKKAFFCYSDNHFCLSGRNTFDAFWVLKQIFK